MGEMMPIVPDLAPLLLACLVAFLASVLGGLSGFGTGLVLPAFLAPLVGVAAVVPVMAVAMLFNNGGRVFAFWRDIAWMHLRRLLWLGLPACVAGAYGYTLLSSDAIAFALGAFLLASIPLRRALRAANLRLSPAWQVVTGGCFGFVNGGMSGAGILLISFLMAADLAGSALIATDALISFVMGCAKVLLFGSLSALSAHQAVIGLVVGACTAPGAFVARWLLRRLPAGLHAWIMEAVVLVGALSLLRQAF